MKDDLPTPNRLASNILFLYAFFSSVWILGSDQLLMLLTNDSDLLTELQTVKGWVFVLITSGLLYVLVRWGMQSLHASNTEQKQLLEELRREKEDLAALSIVTANGISTLKLEELLHVMLRRIVNVMHADAAVILLKKDNHLCVRACIGISEAAHLEHDIPIGQGFAGTIAATRRSLCIEDAQEDVRVTNPLIKQSSIRTMLGVPLERQSNLVGVLHVDWLKIHPISDRELHLLEITAERCTMAILNAQLYEHSLQLQERLQLQINCMPIGCIVNNSQLRVTDWNPAAEKIFGFTKDEVLGKDPCELITPPTVHSLVQDIFRQLAAGETKVYSINENLTKDGRTIICEWYNTPLTSVNGTVVGMLSMAQDITERRQAEQELRRKDELYRTLARNFPNCAVFLFDQNLRYTLAEGSGITALGLTSELLEGKTIWEALSPEMSHMLEPVYQQALAGVSSSFEALYNGKVYFVQVLPVTNSSGEIYAGMAVTQDITERKQMDAQLWNYAFYEPLTGLPNRALFLERVEERIKRGKGGQEGLFAVLLLKLENFEMVKHSLGHQVADQLVIAMARRLETFVQPSDTVARLGSDEFSILLTQIQDHNEATEVAERIHQLLMLPLDLNGHEVFSTTSIGIAIGKSGDLKSFTLDSSQEISEPSSPINPLTCSDRPKDFLHAADTARHHAQAQAQVGHAVFNPTMHEQAVERFELETDLRWAIERQQFQVYYQPIVSLESGKITGLEALVRWNHPTRGMVPPGEFIPLAEETGLITLIDWWVMREACTQLAVWQKTFAAEPPLTMSVNLSSLQLAQVGLLERLDKILQETSIDGRSLKLEITESSLLKNATTGTVTLQQLKTLGIQLSIDDFGTGYSSLARLHQLPIDTLKIDRSFVNPMVVESDSLEIVRTIITLAHSLKKDVIAEGVETNEQLAQLRSLQCEYGQGYFFSKPLDSEAAGELLASQLQW